MGEESARRLVDTLADVRGQLVSRHFQNVSHRLLENPLLAPLLTSHLNGWTLEPPIRLTANGNMLEA